MSNTKAYNRLKSILAEKNITGRMLADRLKLNEATVSRWSRNYRQPPIEKLYQIAEALNVPVCSLLIENQVKEELKDT